MCVCVSLCVYVCVFAYMHMCMLKSDQSQFQKETGLYKCYKLQFYVELEEQKLKLDTFKELIDLLHNTGSQHRNCTGQSLTLVVFRHIHIYMHLGFPCVNPKAFPVPLTTILQRKDIQVPANTTMHTCAEPETLVSYT